MEIICTTLVHRFLVHLASVLPKQRALEGLFVWASEPESKLEFFEEIARRTGDIHSAGSTALTVLDALYDAGRFGALRTIGALVGVHDLLTVAGLGNLRHNA